MAAWLLVLLSVFSPAQAPEGLLVKYLSGRGAGRLSLADLGLAAADRTDWLDAAEIGSFVRTRAGTTIHCARREVRVRAQDGPEIRIDGRARFTSDRGPLTRSAVQGLALRLEDGSELRVVPGGDRHGPREVSFVDNGTSWLLWRRGRRAQGRSKARPFFGLEYYLVSHGRAIYSLVSLGPGLYCRPLAAHGQGMEPFIVVQGDLIREAVYCLRDRTPARSVQYPLAKKQAVILADLCRQLIPAHHARTREHRALRGIGLTLALSPELRLRLARRGANPNLVLSLHLAPEAEASLEFVSFPGHLSLQRVLPPKRQTRSRNLSRGVRLETWIASRLPWSLPLAHPAQRARALRELRPYLETSKVGTDSRHSR
ncbi:MAG: hypothetical protein ACE5F1_00330 [Planctomycetota bacterium]